MVNRKFATPLLVVSISYVLAFALTDLLVTPIQSRFLPEITRSASLIFLPHGVRVLTAWMCGWRSILWLAPASFATGIYYFGLGNFSATYAMAAATGVIAAAATFWTFAQLGMDYRYERSKLTNWRDVMLVGAAASVVNSICTSLLVHSDLVTTSVRFLGDVIGLFVSLLVLMVAFRQLRRFAAKGRDA